MTPTLFIVAPLHQTHLTVCVVHKRILKQEATSVIWPGSYLEFALLSDLQPECTLAIESRTDSVKFLNNWPPPSIIEAVSGKVRILNNTD